VPITGLPSAQLLFLCVNVEAVTNMIDKNPGLEKPIKKKRNTKTIIAIVCVLIVYIVLSLKYDNWIWIWEVFKIITNNPLYT